MSELQPGMLALVIGCTKFPTDVGKIVKLDRFLNAGDATPDNGYATKDLWLAIGENLHRVQEGNLVADDYGLSMSKHLLPIKPEADPLEIKVNQELHA